MKMWLLWWIRSWQDPDIPSHKRANHYTRSDSLIYTKRKFEGRWREVAVDMWGCHWARIMVQSYSAKHNAHTVLDRSNERQKSQHLLATIQWSQYKVIWPLQPGNASMKRWSPYAVTAGWCQGSIHQQDYKICFCFTLSFPHFSNLSSHCVQRRKHLSSVNLFCYKSSSHRTQQTHTLSILNMNTSVQNQLDTDKFFHRIKDLRTWVNYFISLSISKAEWKIEDTIQDIQCIQFIKVESLTGPQCKSLP